jgi:deoxyadenosine/deoxycytidine kinase
MNESRKERRIIYPIVKYANRSNDFERFKRFRSSVLCIAGPPGVGKSRLAQSIASHLQKEGIRTQYFPEKVNTDHLAVYLDDKETEAFSFQYCMVTRRLTTYIEAVNFAESGGFSIVDGPIMTDNTFELWNYEAGFIDEKHHTLYCNMVKEIGSLPKPDYLVYLDCSPETAVRRLAKRQNFAEMKTYSPEYYKTYRELHTVTVGDMRIATIPYDTDYKFDNCGFLEKETTFAILEDIGNRIYENDGIVDKRPREDDKIVVVYDAMKPIYLKKKGDVYIPVKEASNQ